MLSLIRFVRYARAFEKTLADDDWERIKPFFRDDAIYQVIDDEIGCELVGPEAITAGIKKSLDGFDRRFPRRSVRLTRRPALGWNRVRVWWSVTYKHDTWGPYTLAGSSDARYRGGRIARLVDRFAPGSLAEMRSWMEANGVELDPSYV